MRLWTIQDPRVWEVLRETDHFRADGRRAYHHFRPAYRWMVGQMERRLPGYPRGRYPVWAWHTPKPDMRMSSYRLAPGEESVRLTLEIPDEEVAGRVLLSGFEDWHSPLNNRYLWLSDEEYQWWKNLAGEHRFGTKVPGHLQEMIHRSWERVFDLEALDRAARTDDPETYAPPRVQATFAEIRLREVVKAERFRGLDLKG